MAAMTTFHTEKCCRLVSAHIASALIAPMQRRPPVPVQTVLQYTVVLVFATCRFMVRSEDLFIL